MTLRRAALWTLLAAKLIGAWGLAWDIQWHITIGRDSFWIPPHVMMYASVAVATAIGFGVLALETLGMLGGGRTLPRFLGLRGTPGFHLAAWGVAVVLLAAPVDDLWHRLFGLDVTLWSPPHLLGLLGSAINTVGCLVIAAEVHGRNRRARLVSVVLAGGLLYNGLRVTLDPAYLLAYNNGGVLFDAPTIMGVMVLPLALLAASCLADRRWVPVAILVTVIALNVTAEMVSAAGFAIVKPVSVIGEEIKKDPASPIAQANAINQKNGRTRPTVAGRLFALIPVAIMAAIDPRRRPISATLGYAAGFFLVTRWYLARSPAFQPMAPGSAETAVAIVVVAVAAVIGGLLARRCAEWLAGLRPEARPAAAWPAELAPSRTPAQTT